MFNEPELFFERNEVENAEGFGANRRGGCGCNKVDCRSLCRCAQRRIFTYLGNYAYDLLSELDLPCGHPSLNASLLALACGKELPCGHENLEQLLCQALREERREEDECAMPWLCEDDCGGCGEGRRGRGGCGGCNGGRRAADGCGGCNGGRRAAGGCSGCNGGRRAAGGCGGCNGERRTGGCRREVTPEQLEGIKLYLGCKVFGYLKRLDLPCGHPSLECSLLNLAYGEELPCGHASLNDLLARALRCRCQNR